MGREDKVGRSTHSLAYIRQMLEWGFDKEFIARDMGVNVTSLEVRLLEQRKGSRMTIKDLSLKLAAISLLADQAKRLKDELRAELQGEMNNLGADRVKAELGDEVIAYITTTKPKFKWVIKSDRKFIDWVKTNVPSEIVESVRESSVDKILEKFNYLDDVVIDSNGEIVDWLEGSESEPYLTTKFHGEGRAKLRDAIIGLNGANEIDVRKVLELEG